MDVNTDSMLLRACKHPEESHHTVIGPASGHFRLRTKTPESHRVTGAMRLNLSYLVPRVIRHFLPEKLVRALLLRNIIIKPGLETSDPDAAVQRSVRTLPGTLKGKRILIFGYGGRFDL